MIHAISYILLYNFAITIPFTLKDHQTVKKITKNQMTVCWEYKADRIYFEMEAPTNGWIAIGFNSRNQIVGSYLLMGNVVGEKVNVVEHYTLAMGDYRPIKDLGSIVNVDDISGKEEGNYTRIGFSLPIQTGSKYGVNLGPTWTYTIHLAYSQEDDFQHHSIMRTYVEGVRMGDL